MLPGHSSVSQAMVSPCCLLLCAVWRSSGVKKSASKGDGQNSGNTRQYRNTTVCVGCSERTLVVVIFHYAAVCLCCVEPRASVNALQTVFSNSSYQSTAKWETCRIFRGRIVGACVAGASVDKMASLLDVSRGAVSKVIMAYTNHGEMSSAKRNNSQKPKLRGTHCTAGWVGSTTILDGCGISRPQPGFNSPTVQPVESCYTDWAIPVHLPKANLHWNVLSRPFHKFFIFIYNKGLLPC